MKKLNPRTKKTKALSPAAKAKASKRFNCYVRCLYALVAIGYICSLVAVIVFKDPLKEYNTKAIQYVSLANQGLKTYNSIQEINSVVQDQISTAYNNPQEMIKGNVDKFSESLFDKKIFGDTKTSTKRSKDGVPPNLDYLLKQLVSNKILHTVLLAISFAAFSPIILIALIFVITSHRRCVLGLNPKASNNLTLLPHIYVTNLILAIISLLVFYHFTYLGLILAIITHLLFIYQVVNGLRLKSNGYCISCVSKI